MDTEELVIYLTQTFGVSAFEGEICETLRQCLIELGFEARIDRFQNVIGTRHCALPHAKTLMLEAHLDQIGLMVSAVEANGHIKFENIGGVDERILLMAEVYIHHMGEKIYGLIMEEEEAKEEDGSGRFYIETGFDSEHLQNQVKVGDPIQLKSQTCLLSGGKMSGCAMDNRAGVVSVLNCLTALKEDKLNCNLAVVFSSQEELGLHGAFSSTYSVMPDYAVAVDVTHGTTPDTKADTGVFELGCGAVICRGPNLHYGKTLQLIETAKLKQIPYEIEVASGGSGTTAWAIQTVKGGVPVLLVSIPLRYMHTNVETVDTNDIDAVARLLTESIRGGVFDA